MAYLFLVLVYTSVCLGFVLGLLIDDDEIPSAVKILMAIFSPIIASLLFGIALGMIAIAKIKGETK